MNDRELLDLGNKAAHPYRMPIHGKWQMEWLKRFVSMVRMEFYKDDILTDAYMAGYASAQADMKECRHCGWKCKPNEAPGKKAYVLQQGE